MLTKMIFATLLLFALSALNGYASEKKREANCTVVIAADLHFDMPPETDQFHHVLAINALGDHRCIDGVILAGDLPAALGARTGLPSDSLRHVSHLR